MVTQDALSCIVGSKDPGAGLITQAVGGMCTLYTSTGETLRCHARGRLKTQGERILPGDVVRFTRVSDDEGVVEEIMPRRSLLVRPYVANVDQVVVVVALDRPQPNLDLLDRLLAVVRSEGLHALIVWNKSDLVAPAEAESYRRVYAAAGFRTVITSPKANQGREELLAGLEGHLTVLAGASGVGKSSLLNWLLREERFETGSISRKLGRGRHTTRSVELVATAHGGWIADSPGFSVLDLSGLQKERLPFVYPEMESYHTECRFSGCLHRTEPGCKVRAMVDEGSIDSGRYERYLRLLDELEEVERRRYQ